MGGVSNLSQQLAQMLSKAERSLAAARRHLVERDYDFAVSRAYYAVFYALEAVLLTRELAFSKHSGVIAAFNREFVRTGVFPARFSKQISRLFRERQIGDYSFGVEVSPERAREDVEIAAGIVRAIQVYLGEKGFL